MYMISTIQETTPPIDTGMGGSDTKSEGSFDSMGEGTKAVDEGAADNKEEKEESAPEQKYGSLQLQLEHNEDNDDNDDCCLRMCKGRRCSCCGKCIARWPRTFAIFFGVVFPLWLLIALSIFFGYFLAELEAPNEISQNNNIMAAQAQVLLLGSLAARAAEVIPTICFELFLLGLPVTNIGPAVEFVLDNTDPFQAGARQQTSPVVGAILSDDLIVVNKTAMYEFMQGCGDVAGPITEALLRRADDVSDIRTTSLTFNWIRCGPWANGLGSSGLLAPRPVDELRPEAQQKIYNQTWYDDQQQLFDKYLEEYMEANLTVYEDYLGANLTILAARLQAFQDSIGNATGGSKCFLNAPGSGEFCLVAVSLSSIFLVSPFSHTRAYYLTAPAWFWFTVMTTIGYGNQAPETTGGRALIYSLGFLSILAFAGILAAAGNIVSAIFDDAVDRIKLHSLTTPWVACVVWGAVYYSWMGFIAAHTKRWKEEDLDVGKW
jgi:hypothetical protein